MLLNNTITVLCGLYGGCTKNNVMYNIVENKSLNKDTRNIIPVSSDTIFNNIIGTLYNMTSCTYYES